RMPPALPTFDPTPAHADAVLSALIDPDVTLHQAAAQANTTVAALARWFEEPHIQAAYRSLCTLAAARAHLIASAHLSAAAECAAKVLHDFNQHTPHATTTPGPTDPAPTDAAAQTAAPFTRHNPSPDLIHLRTRALALRAASVILRVLRTTTHAPNAAASPAATEVRTGTTPPTLRLTPREHREDTSPVHTPTRTLSINTHAAPESPSMESEASEPPPMDASVQKFFALREARAAARDHTRAPASEPAHAEALAGLPSGP
ncbi:MAG TPA: hypothetical protein VHN77_09515, partial [Phycisphaerales bacterium]|nr:hypothetical protein [Phycisphaerales bacterium]